MHRFLSQEKRFLGLDDRLACPETAGVILVPVPFEETSSYGAGSAAGPAAILLASQQIELFDSGLGFEACETAGGISTLCPLPVESGEGGKSISMHVERIVSHWLSAGKKVVTVAGEHTGVVGAVRAHARRYDALTVVQLDAHSDMRAEYLGDSWNHACTMARVFDLHQDVVQVGIRSEAKEERAFVERTGIPAFRAAELKKQDKLGNDWIRPIIDACSENVYVTFDCDVLDPSIMPATGTPEPGGLTWEQVDDFIGRLCGERNVVGLDLSELAPLPGSRHSEFTAAKLIYRFIGHLYKDGAPSA